MAPVQVRGEVLSNRKVGAYHLLTLVAPGIADAARPGHFVAVAVGGPDSSMLLRRLILCGQHSLPIFCFGVLLSFAAHWFLVQVAGGGMAGGARRPLGAPLRARSAPSVRPGDRPGARQSPARRG